MQKLTFYFKNHLIGLLAFISFGFSSLESSIHKFTIYKRADLDRGQNKYVVVFLTDELTSANQVEVLKCVMDSDDKTNSLFLFSEPCYIESENALAIQAKCNAARTMPTDIMSLFEHAFVSDKFALNIDTFLMGVARHLRENKMANQDKDIMSILDLIMHPINQIRKDVQEIENIVESCNNNFLINGYNIYLSYYKKMLQSIDICEEEFKAIFLDKKRPFLDYLHEKYPLIQESVPLFELFMWNALLVCPNFNFLNSFKAILQNQDVSKVFLFQGLLPEMPGLNLEDMLLEIGYSKIHTCTCAHIEESLTERQRVYKLIRELFSQKSKIDLEMIKFYRSELLKAELLLLGTIHEDEFFGFMAPELSSDLFTNNYKECEVYHGAGAVQRVEQIERFLENQLENQQVNQLLAAFLIITSDSTDDGKEKEL